MKRFILITCVIAVGWVGCDTGSGPEETVSTPERPGGPEWVLWKEAIGAYTTGGAVSSMGHPVVYEFSWGEGFATGWGEPERLISWNPRSGTHRFAIRAQARCAEHYDIVSPLSDALVVTIEPHESFTPETFITYCPGPVADFNTFAIQWDGTDNVSASNKLLFSFFLEGYDETWSDFLRQREWGYRQVPDGSYTFRVRAQDEAGNIDTTEASCTFDVAVSPFCDITVTRPADGDVWPDSTLQNILWDYSGDTYAVRIDLYADGLYRRTISWSVFNSGEYEWQAISAYGEPKTGLQFKVYAWANPDCAGWSGVFSIGQ